jgi:hypothetical protein
VTELIWLGRPHIDRKADARSFSEEPVAQVIIGKRAGISSRDLVSLFGDRERLSIQPSRGDPFAHVLSNEFPDVQADADSHEFASAPIFCCKVTDEERGMLAGVPRLK